MKKAACILLTALSIVFIAQAQTTYWYNYTSGNDIRSIIEDGNIMWIGTGGGLVKIDLSINEATFYNATNSALPQNGISCMDLAPDGALWIGTSLGLARFHEEDWIIYNKSNSDLESDIISDLLVDQDGTLWLTGGEYDNYIGLVKFDGINCTNFNTSSSGIPTNHVNAIALNNTGTILLGTYGKGLVFYDGTNWINFNKANSGLPGDYIHAVVADQNNTIWMGYSENSEMGLASFDGSTWNIYDHSNSGMPPDPAYSISIDQEGIIWLAGFGLNPYGLIRFDGSNWINYTTNNSGIPNDMIFAIRASSDGKVWIGTKKGLVSLDGEDWTEHNTSNSGIPYDNRILSITIDSNNTKWIGSYDGLLSFKDGGWDVYNTENTNLENNFVSSPVFDSEGLLWMRTNDPPRLASFDGTAFTYHVPPSYVYGTINGPIVIDQLDKQFFRINGDYLTSNGLVSYYQNSWHKYDSLNTGVNLNTLSAYAIDKSNTLWIGVYDYLVSYDIPYWNGHIVPNNGGQNFSGGATAINFDTNNILWTAFFNGGLHRWDGEDWTAFKTNNSDIPSDIIHDITFDQNNHVWIATEKGLAMFDGTGWFIYTQANSGLTSDIVYKVTIDTDNNKWIICKESGLTLFNEEGLWTSGTDEGTPENSVGIFPNPAENVIRIKSNESINSARIGVYNLMGQLVVHPKASEGGIIDIGFLPAGMYLIHIQGNGFIYTGKFIKQ
ncbi:MAG: T9SS type A sorting domain-containing protein [Bacteroidetes bacterium]|nr:T9SS type A sorting domain-containing protein [Bacteroidota bacterium]